MTDVPNRVLCEGLAISDIGTPLVERVRSNAGMEWATTLDGISEYRGRLLELQKFRCAYCQSSIVADQNGLRELDHVLPKNPSAKRDVRREESSCSSDRNFTRGYQNFCFEPKNLVVVCKQCNNEKGTFDPLFIRHMVPKDYPGSAEEFAWVHPFFTHYSKHIRITRNWFYESRTFEGSLLIQTCKLDDAEVLARRKLAQVYATQSGDLEKCLRKMAANHTEVSMEHCISVLQSEFKVAEPDGAMLISLWIVDFEVGDIESRKVALEKTKMVMSRLSPDCT